ncbi:MAG TPA: TonB-dependent receptor, partial [Saprospiraceae bacterium]|nr:TonB-dependent receptor [Saprospiraceae bacterium]
RVEYVPEWSMRTGLKLKTGAFSLNYMYSWTGDQYSDATNAEYVVDATRGIIPSYQVHDLGLSYNHKLANIEIQVNNLMDASYFTRRATAYPGPGIIPAQARSVFLTLEIKLEQFFK